jgi:hypothetical protein
MTPTETYQHALDGIARLQLKLTDLPLGNSTVRNTNHGHIRKLGPGPGLGLGHPCMSVLAHSHFVNYGGERRGKGLRIALDNTMLHYTTTHNPTGHYTAQHSTPLHCTALHCTALHCTALHALHYTTLHSPN